jgi:hypothetical protein
MNSGTIAVVNKPGSGKFMALATRRRRSQGLPGVVPREVTWLLQSCLLMCV